MLALLPKASADNGQDTFKKCLACHTPDKGGRNLVGPNLWGVVGRKIAQAPGFAYSDAMKSHPGEWTWEELAKYLHDPAGAIPGNKMPFPGVKDNAELADLLAYMRKLSDTPAAAAAVGSAAARSGCADIVRSVCLDSVHVSAAALLAIGR